MDDEKIEGDQRPSLVTLKMEGRQGYTVAASNGIPLKEGDYCVCMEGANECFGKVVEKPGDVEYECKYLPLRKVKRPATQRDIEKYLNKKKKIDDAFKYCLERIKVRDLKMRLVKVKEDEEEHKIIFYYTAESRIDFRELVKDLAARFRARIEMRQIGVRDEARLLKGFGLCGRSYCCSTFLRAFEPISIRMAKEQNINLNPTKISGICGRLMCCLGFEMDSTQKEQIRNDLRRNGSYDIDESFSSENHAAVSNRKTDDALEKENESDNAMEKENESDNSIQDEKDNNSSV